MLTRVTVELSRRGARELAVDVEAEVCGEALGRREGVRVAQGEHSQEKRLVRELSRVALGIAAAGRGRLLQHRGETHVAPQRGRLRIDPEPCRCHGEESRRVIDHGLARAARRTLRRREQELARGVVAAVTDDAPVLEDRLDVLFEGDRPAQALEHRQRGPGPIAGRALVRRLRPAARGASGGDHKDGGREKETDLGHLESSIGQGTRAGGSLR